MRWVLLALAVCSGCGRAVVAEVSDKPDRSDAGWVIRGTTPEKILLTNGTFGVWLDTARGIAGVDAFRMLDGEALISIPKLSFYAEQELQPGEQLDWSFDIRTGEFVAKRHGGSFDFNFCVVMHPTEPVVAVCYSAEESTAKFGRIVGAACGLPKVRTDRKVSGTTDVYRAQGLLPGEADDLGVELCTSIQSDVIGVFLEGENGSQPSSYADVLGASKSAHAAFWRTDIEIDGPADDQLAIRTMLYYLRRGATAKLPPFGASNAKYRGARFWDAEAWMLPALAIVDPQKTIQATEWRIGNTRERIPWEAANDGADVTPKEFGNALHVAGWVAWWFNRAGSLGLVHPKAETGLLTTSMRQYLKQIEHTERGYEIRGVESPDEGKLRNNDLVTNVLARLVGRWSFEHSITREEYILPLVNVILPRADDGLPSTYDNDLMKGYQQTAALLTVYPLEFFEGKVAERLFDRYADLTSEVGPAMSESIHATIAARLGRDDAYHRWRRSWQIFTDEAMMFHEKRLKSADGKVIYPVEGPNPNDAYFMTGAAGCLQTLFFGFAGMNIEPIPDEPADVPSVGVHRSVVTFRPKLPDEWKSMRLKNIWLGNSRVTVTISPIGATIDSIEPGPERKSAGAI